MQEAADRDPLREEGPPSSLVLAGQAAGAETSMGHVHQVVLAESDDQTDRGVACIERDREWIKTQMSGSHDSTRHGLAIFKRVRNTACATRNWASTHPREGCTGVENRPGTGAPLHVDEANYRVVAKNVSSRIQKSRRDEYRVKTNEYENIPLEYENYDTWISLDA